MKIERSLWMKIHNYISVFFLPLAIIFIITGALYLLGIHGSPEKQEIDVQIDRSMMNDTANLTSLVKDAVEKNNLQMPDGEPKKIRDSLVWGDMNGTNIMLSTDRNSGNIQLFASQPTFYSRLVLAHKGKIGMLFNVMAIIFSLSLLITYFSGILLAFKKANTRRYTIITIFSGIIITFIALFISF